jgi:hypothetical protein
VGGYLWLFFEELVPAVLARRVVEGVLNTMVEQGTLTCALELYPNAAAPRRLGHAVRLPLGIHRRTGRRYPLPAPATGQRAPQLLPLPLATPRDLAAAVAAVVAQPRICQAHLEMLVARNAGGACPAADGSAARAAASSGGGGLHDDAGPRGAPPALPGREA